MPCSGVWEKNQRRSFKGTEREFNITQLSLHSDSIPAIRRNKRSRTKENRLIVRPGGEALRTTEHHACQWLVRRGPLGTQKS